MGLLDDAIREHLELKRRHGADPAEVARQQREALDVGASEPIAEADAADDLAGDVADPDVADPAVADPDAAAPLEPAIEGEGIAVGGETAELDMRTVLDADHSDAAASEEESLEWEMPDRAAAPAHEQSPTPEATPEEPGAVDDVLEETPDFLRETPEQERMWFEQRPPRDFDFDK
jgi:hypothetical protein